VKRSIGIDISKNKVSVAQLCRSRGELLLERIHVQQIRNGTSAEESSASKLQAALEVAITKGELDTRAPVVVAMPYGRVFFHNFRTDISSNRDARRLLKFELEDDFPILFDDLVAGICSYRELKEHHREFLVGAVSRLELRDWVKALREAGITCSAVSADACALHTLAKLNHELIDKTPYLVIYADDCRTIVVMTEGNRLVCVRYLNYSDTTEIIVSALRREIELTLRTAFDTHVAVPPTILLSGTNALVNDLSEELRKDDNGEIVMLNPFDQIRYSSQQQEGSESVIALGLALVGISKNDEVLDFLTADTVETGRTAKAKRSLLVFGVLLLAIGALLVVNLFAQLNALEDERLSIKRETREVFTRTLPAEERIVNELAQMTERFEALEAEYSTLATEIRNKAPALKVLQHISEKITPDQHMGVSSISITGKLVRLSGSATSFESVDNVVATLRQISEFDSVELRNVDIDPTNNTVRFSLLIKMEQN